MMTMTTTGPALHRREEHNRFVGVTMCTVHHACSLDHGHSRTLSWLTLRSCENNTIHYPSWAAPSCQCSLPCVIYPCACTFYLVTSTLTAPVCSQDWQWRVGFCSMELQKRPKKPSASSKRHARHQTTPSSLVMCTVYLAMTVNIMCTRLLRCSPQRQ